MTKHLIWRTLALVAVSMAVTAPRASAANGLQTAVKLSICSTGTKPVKRAAQFVVTAVPRRGSVRMAVRTRLYRIQLPPATASPGSAPTVAAQPTSIKLKAWGPWVRTDRRASALVVTRRIDHLTGPAAYYIIAQMRWYGKGGVIKEKKQYVSGRCVQPTYGPDLRFGPIVTFTGWGATPSTPPPTQPVGLTARTPGQPIKFEVSNGGIDASRAAQLRVTANGVVLTSSDVPPLGGANGRTWIVLQLASCPPGATVYAVLTSSAADSEPSYSNNTENIGRCAD